MPSDEVPERGAQLVSFSVIFKLILMPVMPVLAGLRAEDDLRPIWGQKINQRAHRIETRVALSRGDSARFFGKSGRPTPKPTRTQSKDCGSTRPWGGGKPRKVLSH